MREHYFKIITGASKFLFKNRLRGATRFTKFAATNVAALQNYTVRVPGGPLTIDLRLAGVHGIFSDPGQMSGEHVAMQGLVLQDDIVFDIGANAGIFTVWLSNLVGVGGKVVSFEPNPQYVRTLELVINELPNATLLRTALSNSEGEAEFFIPMDDTMASLKDWTDGRNGEVRSITCKKTTIDELILSKSVPHPDFIKCDIEGGEYDCFAGALSLLDRIDAPIILFEANINSTRGFGFPISKAFDFLKSLRKPEFSFFVISESGKLKKIDEIDFQHGNIVACPKSMLSRLGKDE